MAPQEFYRPVERGFEREVAKRMEWWDRRRAERVNEG
jgi:putative ATPase